MRYVLILLAIVVCGFLIFLLVSDSTTMVEGFRVQKLPDKEKAAAVMAEITRRIDILIRHLDVKYYSNGIPEPIDADVGRLMKRFRVENLSEISPNNSRGITSYTKKKKEIVLCLRDKDNSIHDINTLMFVVLHEITHLMNDTWQHDAKFWSLFRQILKEAAECGIYLPVDYSKTPKKYCGIIIDSNPMFSSTHLFSGRHQ